MSRAFAIGRCGAVERQTRQVLDFAKLAYAEQVHRLNAGDPALGDVKDREAERRPGDVFDAMGVSLDDVVPILRLACLDGRFPSARMPAMATESASYLSIVTARIGQRIPRAQPSCSVF